MNANSGVSFFFVLSGFLITYLLLKEKEHTATISFSTFYLKRTLRIWPLYFLILFITFVLVPYFSYYKGSPDTDKSMYVFFLGNFDLVKHGVGNFLSSILWSISIEEQFYLFWPLLISFIPLKHLPKFLIVLIIFSIWYRIYGHSGKSFNLKLTYHTFSCLYTLAIGAILAHLSFKENFILKVKNMNKYFILFIYLIGFVLLFTHYDLLKLEPRGSHYLVSLLPVVHAFFFAFIVAEQIYAENSLFKVGNISIFTTLGQISYGLYCYHMLSIFITFVIFTNLKYNTEAPDTALFISELFLSLGLTILTSHLSYHYFEKKFLAYKNKLSYAPKIVR